MVITTDSVWDALADLFIADYRNATVYADYEQETILYEGALRILANGWIELPTGRLLSPEAIHHIDTEPESSD